MIVCFRDTKRPTQDCVFKVNDWDGPCFSWTKNLRLSHLLRDEWTFPRPFDKYGFYVRNGSVISDRKTETRSTGKSL